MNLTVRSRLLAVARRFWLVFCLAYTVGLVLMCLLDGDNPLHSDDPHIIGFLLACIAVGFAVVYSAAELNPPWSGRKHRIALIALLLWCLFWVGMEFAHDGEGDGFPTLYAIASLIAGAVAWPVCAVRVPYWPAMAISLCGLTCLLMGLMVSISMSMR